MNNRSALAQEFGSKPGTYDLVIGVSQPIVDPDDRFWVEVYISGYGLIHAAKVLILYSPSAFITDSSRVRCGNGEWKPLDPQGNVVSLHDPSFFDAGGRYQIATEGKTDGNAPVQFDLAISKRAKAGPHSIQFVLTYFDGQTWKTASKNADFTIRNFYQRHEGVIWWIGGPLGFLAAVITIATGIVTLWPITRTHWPISIAVAGACGLAAVVGKVVSRWRRRSRAK
jgi:hypothetical protein